MDDSQTPAPVEVVTAAGNVQSIATDAQATTEINNYVNAQASDTAAIDYDKDHRISPAGEEAKYNAAAYDITQVEQAKTTLDKEEAAITVAADDASKNISVPAAVATTIAASTATENPIAGTYYGPSAVVAPTPDASAAPVAVATTTDPTTVATTPVAATTTDEPSGGVGLAPADTSSTVTGGVGLAAPDTTTPTASTSDTGGVGLAPATATAAVTTPTVVPTTATTGGVGLAPSTDNVQTAVATATNSVNASAASTSSAVMSTYRVVAGDTLSSIAEKNNVKLEDLEAVNKSTIQNDNLIYPHQLINIPAGGTTVSTTDPTTAAITTEGGATTAVSKDPVAGVTDAPKVKHASFLHIRQS